MQLFVRPNGMTQCLYSDDIPLAQFGALDIKRASHVEPAPDNPGTWYVDLRPVGGPLTTGYKSRADALRAEELWLNNTMRERHVVAQST